MSRLWTSLHSPFSQNLCQLMELTSSWSLCMCYSLIPRPVFRLGLGLVTMFLSIHTPPPPSPTHTHTQVLAFCPGFHGTTSKYNSVLFLTRWPPLASVTFHCLSTPGDHHSYATIGNQTGKEATLVPWLLFCWAGKFFPVWVRKMLEERRAHKNGRLEEGVVAT